MPPSSQSENPFEIRFRFLFPSGSNSARKYAEPRYKLCAPDVLESRWVVWDQPAKRTIAMGRTAEEAVDNAVISASTIKDPSPQDYR